MKVLSCGCVLPEIKVREVVYCPIHRGSTKTNFIDLLQDVISHLDNCATGEYGYRDPGIHHLYDRCREALTELEEI